ncbi:MAG TPA: amidohydrolase family protein [Desulfomonilia bacterium]|nr:amidohydrolase family protein [Desulfomonilia bacterium]
MGTILLRDGTIIDGTGRLGFPGHVLLEDDSIKDVLKPGSDTPFADEIIDADGMSVCPGFIDMHSHSDWLLPLDENDDLLKCLIEQGITTVIAGNCGFSPAPSRPETFWKLQQHTPLLERKFDASWTTMGPAALQPGRCGLSIYLCQLSAFQYQRPGHH